MQITSSFSQCDMRSPLTFLYLSQNMIFICVKENGNCIYLEFWRLLIKSSDNSKLTRSAPLFPAFVLEHGIFSICFLDNEECGFSYLSAGSVKHVLFLCKWTFWILYQLLERLSLCFIVHLHVLMLHLNWNISYQIRSSPDCLGASKPSDLSAPVMRICFRIQFWAVRCKYGHHRFGSLKSCHDFQTIFHVSLIKVFEKPCFHTQRM